MLILLLGLVLVVLVYLKLTKHYKYWEEKGVPHPKPWIIMGNMGSNLFRRKDLTTTFQDIYNLYPEERYIGLYQFLQPMLMLRDPELIKQITVKDFDTFPDHRSIVSSDVDPLFSKNLFAMSANDGWHNMRSTLSPSFTSSKMKTMYILMQQCAEQFINYFKSQPNGITTVELKDTFTRFTNDVIGTTAFGITCDSLKDKNNQFYLMGKDATNFGGLRFLKLSLFLISPALMKLLNVKIVGEKVTVFFSSLIKETLRVREEKQIVRPDMIHLLMEAQKGRLKHNNEDVVDSGFAVAEESEIGKAQNKPKSELTHEDITAQALIFFLAGFDTASNLLCYVAYELALHPDLQEKLREEINESVEKYNGTVTYEALLGMKYLDNVVTETLRLHPPVGFVDRKSVKPYTFNPEGRKEQSLHLEKDAIIFIPIHAIHMDSKYHPDPYKFDPDRFSDENKHKIKPYTYIPFGVGPRNCIGSRFALLETKLIIVELLRNFELVPVEKTQIPITLSKSSAAPLPDGGLWLGFKSR